VLESQIAAFRGGRDMSNPRLLTMMGIVFWTMSAVANGQPQARARSDDVAVQDAAVLEVVFQDILGRPNVVELPERAAKRMLVSIESSDSEKIQVRASDVLQEFPGEKTFFATLSKEQSELVREAAEDLARRANAKDAIKPFVPKDKRIKTYSKKEQKEYRPKNFADLGPQVFHALPPGYSQKRQLAIVFVDFGWSGNLHPAMARYILIKKQGRWIVLRASLFYFA
jgi:hypothetical protein